MWQHRVWCTREDDGKPGTASRTRSVLTCRANRTTLGSTVLVAAHTDESNRCASTDNAVTAHSCRLRQCRTRAFLLWIGLPAKGAGSRARRRRQATHAFNAGWCSVMVLIEGDETRAELSEAIQFHSFARRDAHDWIAVHIDPLLDAYARAS